VKNLLAIGRFAQVTRISIRMLRHYDDLGLLRPAHVDEASGYRYYSLGQAPEAERIRLLRSLDMPLEEIRELLRARDPDALQARLARHHAWLESQIARYQEALTVLRSLAPSHPYAISVRDVEPQPFLGRHLRATLREIGRAMGQGFAALVASLQELGLQPVGPPFAQFQSEFPGAELDYEVGLPVDRLLVDGGQLPGGQIVSTLHTGPYAALGHAYQALAAWLQERARETAGPPREVYLVGPGQAKNPADYRTEVVWPLRA
jgi:DNA-binding transcriptional MerR regulator